MNFLANSLNKILKIIPIFFLLVCFNNANAYETIEDFESYTFRDSADSLFNNYDLPGSDTTNWFSAYNGNPNKSMAYYGLGQNNADGFYIDGYDFSSSTLICFDINFSNYDFGGSSANTQIRVSSPSGTYRAFTLFYGPIEEVGQMQVKDIESQTILDTFPQNEYINQCFYLDIPSEQYFYCSNGACQMDNPIAFDDSYRYASDLTTIQFLAYTYSDTGYNNQTFIDNLATTDDYFDLIYSGQDKKTYKYDNDLDENYPDFNTVVSQTCIIGNTCNLYFSYNEMAIGYPMYLIQYEDFTSPEHAIAETIVNRSYFWQNKITVPPVTEEKEKLYNLLLDADTFGWIVETGIKINWISSSTWNEYIEENIGEVKTYCDESVICSNVATTSDILYGIQCGFQKTICWTFAPTEDSKQFLLNSIESYEKTFPNNLYFSFVNKLQYEIDNTEKNQKTIDIPYIDPEGMYYMLPVVTSTTMQNALGTSYNTVYNGLVSFIWIITGLLVMGIVWLAVWK